MPIDKDGYEFQVMTFDQCEWAAAGAARKDQIGVQAWCRQTIERHRKMGDVALENSDYWIAQQVYFATPEGKAYQQSTLRAQTLFNELQAEFLESVDGQQIKSQFGKAYAALKAATMPLGKTDYSLKEWIQHARAIERAARDFDLCSTAWGNVNKKHLEIVRLEVEAERKEAQAG